MSREYLENYLVDAWLARRARNGPTTYTYKKIEEASTDRDFARAWMQEVPPWRGKYFRHRGHRCHFQIYDTLSFAHEGYVDVVEIRNGVGQLMAWAYLHHLPGASRVSIVKELFVWPSHRRQGLGTKLEAALVFRAQVAKSFKLEAWVYEIDAWPHVRAVARTFVQRRGYSVRWRKLGRPAVAFIAEKTIIPEPT